MVKITYDENNKEDVKFVENYFWYKYFCEMVKSDWVNYYEENKYKKNYYETIIKHINKYELKKASKIHKNIYYNKINKKMPSWYIIDDILMGAKPQNIYKYELIRKFKDNK